MPTYGPVGFSVDTTELDRPRRELQTLQAELDALPAALGGDAAWNSGRARITANFAECPTRADGATHTCAGAETAIHNATRPPSGPAYPETP
jgi:hypothetical protein